MSALDDDLLQDYLAECREHLAGIESDLLAIERRGADIDEERVNKVFRAAHSIKGGAGFFSLTAIRELAHKTENVLDLIRSRQTVPSPEVVNVLLLAFDKLRALIDDPAAGVKADVSTFVATLEGLAASRLPQPCKDSVTRKIVFSAPERRTKLAVTEFDFDSARKTGKIVYLVQYDLIHDVQRRGKNPLTVLKHLMKYGILLDTVFDLESAGTLDDQPSNRLCLDVLYGTALGPELILDVVEVASAQVWMADQSGECRPLPRSAPDEEEGAEPAAPPQAPPEAPAPEVAAPRECASEAAVSAAVDATVRLPVTLLDSLMNLAGELVLSRNQLNDAIARQDASMIQASSQRISLVTSDVQEAVMRTRMQPVGNLFQKFPRQVRDTARKLGKQVRLVIEGGEVELDKTIIEGLSDPLTHMVRNAIDHGLEAPEARASRRKPREGVLCLRAWHEAGLVVVEVADDGRGLDAERIAASAVAKGAISAEAACALSEAEKLALIFLPGVSTSERVNELSGRGVGMDVVKTNLNRLGGKVDIHSETGKGAAFRIRLPLTLAIIPSLLVSVGEQRLAIPQVNVQELIRIPVAEAARRIDRVGSSQVLMLRDSLVPLLDLNRVLHDAASAQPPDAIPVVLVAGGGYRYGLVVERPHATMEIVVKPLGRHLKHLAEYAGATILGDGCVSLILDIAGLAAAAGLETQRAAAALPESAAAGAETHHLLLFRNSPAETCALPLPLVERVEKILPEQVEHAGGRRCMQYRGRSLPLIQLADVAQAGDLSLDQDSVVVVLQVGGREIGLLGARPVDVMETDAEIDPYTLRQHGIAGSAILRGRTTLVLDAFELAGKAWPAWNPQGEAAAAPVPGGATVLVVEDSAFFREQVTRLVESAGCAVVAAEDGQAGWELLQERGHEIALVVTDVEMPRLDGLELARRIRGDSRLAHLPVVMLTSLAADDDVRRGHEAGAAAYCIKLDREQLLATIHELLERPHAPETEMGTALAQLASGMTQAPTPAVCPMQGE